MNMGRHTEDFYRFVSAGFDRTEAMEKANQITLNRFLDEDEEYLREQEALDDDELEELDGYNDDDPEYDEDDLEGEIDFDGQGFPESDEDDY